MIKIKNFIYFLFVLLVALLSFVSCSDNTEVGNGENEPSECEHIFGEWSVSISPSCVTSGKEERKCQRDGCEVYESRSIDALGCDFGEWYSEGTVPCYLESTEKRCCTRLGCDAYETRKVSPVGCDFGDWHVSAAPTCKLAGEERRECKRESCNGYETRVVSALGCELGEWRVSVAPTCKSAGEERRECKRDGCSEYETRSYGEPLGCDFGEWRVSVAPTCELAGEERRECKRESCNGYETRVAGSLGCEFGDWRVSIAPTCKSAGEERRDCKRLGCDKYETKETAADECTVCTIFIAASDTAGKYNVRITPKNENNSLFHETVSEHYTCKGAVVYEDGAVIDGGFNLDTYLNSVDTLIIGDGYEFVEDIGSTRATNIHVAASVKTVGRYAFDLASSGRENALHLYFYGDAPEVSEGTLIINAEYSFSHIKEGAKGFDGFLFYGTNIRGFEEIEPALPDMSIYEYASASVERSGELASELFRAAITASAKEIMLMPICSISYYRNIKDFTLELTEGLSTESEKAKAIYDWIISKIEYSDDAMFYTCEQVFETKKAVCAGYAFVMHDMLASVGIMSFYTSGVIPYENAEISDVFELRMDGKAENHAWIIAYVDGEALMIDPTFGTVYGDVYFGFDETDTVGGVRIVYDVDMISVVPTGVDYALYDSILYYADDGAAYYVCYGASEKIGGATYNRNFVYSVTYDFCYNALASVTLGEISIGASYRGGIAYYVNSESNGYGFWYYYLPHGHRISYLDLLKFAFVERDVYGNELDLYIPEGIIGKDGFLFEEYGEGLLLVGSYLYQEKMTIPSEVNGLPVIAIGERAFTENSVLEEIVLPDSVERICTWAFYGCTSLEKIVMCGVKRIDSSAFADCYKLKSVDFSEGLVYIGDTAFSSCSSLEEVYVPASLVYIGEGAFNYCISLRSFSVSEENTVYTSESGVLYNKEKTKLFWYPTKKNGDFFAVPEGVIEIGNNAFCYSSLVNVSLPSTLEVINDFAFFGCEMLEKIIIPDGVTTINQSVFSGCKGLKIAVLPKNLSKIANGLFEYSGIEEIIIPEDVTIIEDMAFTGCDSLRKVTISGNLEYIGSQSFCNLKDTLVIYSGSESEWNEIEKMPEWNFMSVGMSFDFKD